MGYDSFGMSASAATQDLCTKVNQYFSSLGYVVNGVRATSKDFERRLVKSEREEILAEKLYPELDKSTDILVIVLSDNIVNDEMLDAFRDTFAELLDSAQSRMSDSAKIICVSSWYTSGTIDKAREIVEAKSRERGVTFVDISDLYADEGNRSYLGAVIFRNDVRQYSMSYDAISEVACTLTIRFSVEGKTVSSTIIPDSYEIDYEKKVVSYDYSGAAEPPVRKNGSHHSRPREPPIYSSFVWSNSACCCRAGFHKPVRASRLPTSSLEAHAMP